jgi:hypothetical protein
MLTFLVIVVQVSYVVRFIVPGNMIQRTVGLRLYRMGIICFPVCRCPVGNAVEFSIMNFALVAFSNVLLISATSFVVLIIYTDFYFIRLGSH